MGNFPEAFVGHTSPPIGNAVHQVTTTGTASVTVEQPTEDEIWLREDKGYYNHLVRNRWWQQAHSPLFAGVPPKRPRIITFNPGDPGYSGDTHIELTRVFPYIGVALVWAAWSGACWALAVMR